MNTTIIRRSHSERAAHVSPLFGARRLATSGSNFRLLFFLLALSLAGICSPAQEAHPTEFQVKAAYLYNFGKFVRWQVGRSASSDSVDICVLGKDPFGAILDATVAGESIDARKIAVKRISRAQDAAPCNILFVSSSEENRLDAVLATVRHFGSLTVSDIPHFAERGGVIEFVMQQGKIRFEVNREAGERSHLVLSSELLKVAIKVIDKAAPQGQP
jgi:hypothetical protein